MPILQRFEVFPFPPPGAGDATEVAHFLGFGVAAVAP